MKRNSIKCREKVMNGDPVVREYHMERHRAC